MSLSSDQEIIIVKQSWRLYLCKGVAQFGLAVSRTKLYPLCSSYKVTEVRGLQMSTFCSVKFTFRVRSGFMKCFLSILAFDGLSNDFL